MLDWAYSAVPEMVSRNAKISLRRIVKSMSIFVLRHVFAVFPEGNQKQYTTETQNHDQKLLETEVSKW
jgi:hypothetical protein